MAESEKLIIFLVIIFSCFLLAMGVFFFVLFNKYHRSLKLRQMEALNNLIIGQDNERERIARDLHDEVGPELSSIIFTMDEIKSVEPTILEVKQRAKTRLKEAIGTIRQISHDLKPITLAKYGLVESIYEIIDKNKKTIPIEFTTNLKSEKFNDLIESHLDKIIKELIYNTQKHSQASSIAINVTYNENKKQIEFNYCDNGQNSFNATHERTGIGIKNINTRVGLMNGNIHIDRTNGFKTSIIIKTDLK